MSFNGQTARRTSTTNQAAGKGWRVACAALAIMALPLPAWAGPASDAVRVFYQPEPSGEWDPEIRDRFVDPARGVFAKNDVLAEESQGLGCLDFVLAIDAQDYDQATIDQTLQLTERVDGETAEVVALFRLFPDQAEDVEVVWSLKQVDGAWKVSDIASDGRWRLSEFDCG